MAGKRELVVVAALTSIIAIYLLAASGTNISSQTLTRMTNAGDGTVSIKDLVVTLADGATKNPSSITVTIENKNPRQTLTFLKWDTPIDPAALNSGVFKIHDLTSGEEVSSPGIRMSRMLPPSREDLVEVQPKSSLSALVELKARWIPEDGRSVKVEVEGEWRAVWFKAKEQVEDGEMHAMSGDGSLRGTFRSVKDLELQL